MCYKPNLIGLAKGENRIRIHRDITGEMWLGGGNVSIAVVYLCITCWLFKHKIVLFRVTN